MKRREAAALGPQDSRPAAVASTAGLHTESTAAVLFVAGADMPAQAVEAGSSSVSARRETR